MGNHSITQPLITPIVLSLLYHCYGTKVFSIASIFFTERYFQKRKPPLLSTLSITSSVVQHFLINYTTTRLCAIILTYKNHLFSKRVSLSPENISVNCYILK